MDGRFNRHKLYIRRYITITVPPAIQSFKFAVAHSGMSLSTPRTLRRFAVGGNRVNTDVSSRTFISVNFLLN